MTLERVRLRSWLAAAGATRPPVGRAQRLILGIAPVVAVIVLWWIAAAALGRPRVYPTPPVVFTALLDILQGQGAVGSTYMHIAATLGRLAAAFSFALVVGTMLGILAGRIPLVFSLLENVVWVFLAVPSIVWVFIFAVGLGISDVVPIAAISALLTPMILINVAEGAKSVPPDLLEMASAYKATPRQRVVHLLVPFLVPYIASSARTAFALGVKLVVVAEVVGLASGIGYELGYWYDRLFMGPVVAWGVVMIVIGLVVDYGIFGPIERRVSRWKGRSGQELVAGALG